MVPLLQSATTAADGHAVVTVCGDLDADTALQSWQYLSYLISQGHHHIVLDLRGMILIDSVGQPGPGRAAGARPPGRGSPAPSFRRRSLTSPRERRPSGRTTWLTTGDSSRVVLAANPGRPCPSGRGTGCG
jgi:hypothetical protein